VRGVAKSEFYATPLTFHFSYFLSKEKPLITRLISKRKQKINEKKKYPREKYL
jgi:hypothetical protein